MSLRVDHAEVSAPAERVTQLWLLRALKKSVTTYIQKLNRRLRYQQPLDSQEGLRWGALDEHGMAISTQGTVVNDQARDNSGGS